MVDTSALVAILGGEDGFRPIAKALRVEPLATIISPVLVEFHRVTNDQAEDAQMLIEKLVGSGVIFNPFTIDAAQQSVRANPLFGKGNKQGGKLNLLDLMVYGAAKAAGYPILCTGRDFASTDAAIHPASRID